MAKLSVNVDHVATVRQARLSTEPDPVVAAAKAELSGADGITVHLREDRRHIQDRDVYILRKTVKTELNLEMAATKEMLDVALEVKPDMVTIVPEKRQELTTEGGLDVKTHGDALKKYVSHLKDAGIRVNLFIDPSPEAVKSCHRIGSDGVEIHTGAYAGHERAGARIRTQEDIRYCGPVQKARHEDPRGPRTRLQQHTPGRLDKRDRRVRDRLQHNLPRSLRRHRGCRKGDEEAHNSWQGQVGLRGRERPVQSELVFLVFRPRSDGNKDMIHGIGIDTVEISRFKRALDRWGDRLKTRLFTPGELAYCLGQRSPERHLSARFAAKVSFFKALGRPLAFRDVEVSRDPAGAPSIVSALSKKACACPSPSPTTAISA